jgi:hypothetical protein
MLSEVWNSITSVVPAGVRFGAVFGWQQAYSTQEGSLLLRFHDLPVVVTAHKITSSHRGGERKSPNTNQERCYGSPAARDRSEKSGPEEAADEVANSASKID